MKKTLIFLFICITSFTMSMQIAIAQSWVITGNNNTSPLSKLGTTNFIPLGLYTDDKERIHIDELGRVGIGTSAPVNVLTVKSTTGTPAGSWLSGLTSPVFVGFADNASSEFVLSTASNTAVRRSVIQGRKSRGSLDVPTVVANNDYLASFLASGYDGSTFQNPATIDFFVDGVPSAGNVPARISFVTGSNQGNRLERLKVGSTGNFDFNNGQVTLQQSTGNVGIGTGNLTFSNAFQTIQFPSPGVTSNPMMNIYSTGTVNNPRMVFAHSPAYPNWGIQYRDDNDAFDFLSDGTSVFYVGLGSRFVGVGTPTPGYLLDVAGRMRLRNGTPGNTAGSWLMNAANTADVAFIGLPNDNSVGFYGSAGAGWGVSMNLASGNLGVGTLFPGAYKTKVSHGSFGLDIENASSGSDWELYTFDNLGLYFDVNFRGSFNSTTGVYTPVSDERLKANIKPMNTMLERINKLKPSTYQFKNTADKQEYMGFIAQDVMKIFPSLVTHNVSKERDLDLYTLDYNGFGVIAVKGIQELQVVLEEKDQQITTLKNEINDLKELLISKGFITRSELNNSASSGSLSKASLAQSIPNPSAGITTLGYYLPNDTKKASMEISSINGAVLKSYPITQKGNGQLTVNSKDFAAGVYVYTLIVNGNKLASKKMIVAK